MVNIVLVVGPFAYLSDDFPRDFMVLCLCDFLGRTRALKAIYNWNIYPKLALAIDRHFLVYHFDHLANMMWAKLILRRFRDAMLPDFSRFPASSDDFLNSFFTDPRQARHGRYCGRYVPGA